jgi:phage repressor protein C with HTH and peptisase S24 domain
MKTATTISLERLQELALKLGGGSEIARRANIDASLVSRYLRGNHQPTLANLAAIAQGCGVSLDWLVFGRSNFGFVVDEQHQQTIPYYAQGASAGPGVFAEDGSPSEMIALPAPLLGRSSRTLFALPAEGDSMEPLIRNGALLVAERAQTPREGIHVLVRNEMLLVKRIQPRGPGILRISSENPAYAAEDARLDEPHQNLRILGRVIWIGHPI